MEAVKTRKLFNTSLYLAQIIHCRLSDFFQPFLYKLVFKHIPVPGNKNGKFLVFRLRAEVKFRGVDAELFPRLNYFYCWSRGYLFRFFLRPWVILSG